MPYTMQYTMVVTWNIALNMLGVNHALSR